MVSTANVLVADDDDDFLEVTRQRLSGNERFDVITAGSGEDALEALDANPVDCVVSDSIVLDSGKPLVVAVRERDGDLPLIYYTGKRWDEVADSAAAAEVTDYVQKGVGSLTQVAERVEVLVDVDRRSGVESGASASESPAERFAFSPLDGDADDSWTVVASFDPEDPRTELNVVIAEGVAAHLGCDVHSFTLYDGVDMDALSTLVLPRPDGTARRSVTVRFPVAGRLVAVTSDGEVAVRDRPHVD